MPKAKVRGRQCRERHFAGRGLVAGQRREVVPTEQASPGLPPTPSDAPDGSGPASAARPGPGSGHGRPGCRSCAGPSSSSSLWGSLAASPTRRNRLDRISHQPAPGMPPGEDPSDILGSDDALNDLANQCFQGDMHACDDLYLDTPVGSDLESYAQTCGGRSEDEQNGGCPQRFPEPTDPERYANDLIDGRADSLPRTASTATSGPATISTASTRWVPRSRPTALPAAAASLPPTVVARRSSATAAAPGPPPPRRRPTSPTDDVAECFTRAGVFSWADLGDHLPAVHEQGRPARCLAEHSVPWGRPLRSLIDHPPPPARQAGRI